MNQILWHNLLFFHLFHLLWPRTANPVVRGWGDKVGGTLSGGGKIVSRCAPMVSGFTDTDLLGGVRTVPDNL